ncbi:MAG: hypothetical protein J0H73_04520 [Salana multivorans]|uniref:DUF6297 family protein n=1 Tax=Salana multivorans TaxID=120377 RepID=UPI000960F7C8|nr:DUF6297 family protein [Salana multivorans]MBN8881563.1 hypothetical protein [Salana multivorans]OJX94760.1 MAG: hypothetical protein BGO96_01470 [Micrococcales bacterium 73-15]
MTAPGAPGAHGAPDAPGAEVAPEADVTAAGPDATVGDEVDPDDPSSAEQQLTVLPLDEPVPGQPVATTRLTGRGLRSLTATARRGHGGAKWTSLFGDVYVSVLSAVVGVTMAVQAARMLGADLGNLEGAAQAAGPALDPAWLVPIVGLAAAGLVLGVVVRLGPVGVGGAGALWWLPTPADRAGLLRPVALAWLAGGAVAGAAVGAVLAGFAHVAWLGWFALVGAGGGAALVAVAILSQRGGAGGRSLASAPVRARRLARLGETCFALAVAAWIALAVARRPAPEPSPVLLAAVLLALAVVLGVVAIAGLGSIPGAVLRARGARTGDATSSVAALDLRGLGRVLTDSGGDVRRRSSALRTVRGPLSAVFTADSRLVLRSPWQLIAFTSAVGLPLALAVSGGSLLMVALFVVVGGALVANVGGAGARAAHDAPVLDRVLGLGARRSRLARLPFASLLVFVWAMVVLPLLLSMRGVGLGWELVPLALLLAPGLASAGIQAAYRKSMDWSQPLVITPQGAYPPGLMSALALGPMLTLIALLPTLVALAVAVLSPATQVPVGVLLLQAVVSSILVAVATHVRKDAGRPARPTRPTSAAATAR